MRAHTVIIYTVLSTTGNKINIIAVVLIRELKQTESCLLSAAIHMISLSHDFHTISEPGVKYSQETC